MELDLMCGEAVLVFGFSKLGKFHDGDAGVLQGFYDHRTIGVLLDQSKEAIVVHRRQCVRAKKKQKRVYKIAKKRPTS